MWVKVHLPPQDWDRMLGFSIPEGNELLLVTYAGIAWMSLGTPRMASNDERYPEGEGIYDMASSELRYEGQTYQIVGIQGGAPILQNQWGEQIVLGVEQEMETPDGRRVKATGEVSTLLIQDADGNPSFEFTFRNFSRDWQRATFSRDGTYIVWGCRTPFTPSAECQAAHSSWAQRHRDWGEAHLCGCTVTEKGQKAPASVGDEWPSRPTRSSSLPFPPSCARMA